MPLGIDKEKIYETEEISQMFDVEHKVIKKLCEDGKLRAKKLGDKWLILGSNLSVFFQDEDDKPFVKNIG